MHLGEDSTGTMIGCAASGVCSGQVESERQIVPTTTTTPALPACLSSTEYVTMVVTEFGMIPPSSVPVILREFSESAQLE